MKILFALERKVQIWKGPKKKNVPIFVVIVMPFYNTYPFIMD
jgi:hypothetical protein